MAEIAITTANLFFFMFIQQLVKYVTKMVLSKDVTFFFITGEQVHS